MTETDGPLHHFLKKSQDVIDGPHGEPKPDAFMQALQLLEEEDIVEATSHLENAAGEPDDLSRISYQIYLTWRLRKAVEEVLECKHTTITEKQPIVGAKIFLNNMKLAQDTLEEDFIKALRKYL